MGKTYLTVLINLFLLLTYRVQGQPAYDKQVMAEMIAFNKKMKSDRLVVSVKDTILTDVTYRGNPKDKFAVYSITKIFSGIAIGILIDKRLIPSPEVPVATFFEELKNDTIKSKITIRHILQHTSGIAANNGSQDIYAQPDFVQFALNSPVITEPGQTFFYNNKAINIISGIVKKVTGQTLEQFIRENVFDPLDINDYEWKHDIAGNTWGMDGLWINANDLMKVGQMLCNYGDWKGKRILSKNWCDMMFQIPLVNSMNGLYGYAMCIRSLPFNEDISIATETIDTLNALGLPTGLTEKLKAVQKKEPYTYRQLGDALKKTLTNQEMEEISAFASRNMVPLYTVTNGNFFIKHGGEYGLLMTAFPKQKKVVVRYLGEKWGRKTKNDGSSGKYFIDDELVNYMIRL